MDSYSELRRNLVSGEWVVIATGRAKRPQEFAEGPKKRSHQPKTKCPFEKEQADALQIFFKNQRGRKSWWVQAVLNKFPAFSQGVCPSPQNLGPYQWLPGIGHHEVIISRDHKRNIAQMSLDETEILIRSMQDRYLAAAKDECVKYVSIFQNHGKTAGASISHPHLQLIAIPVIPPDIGRSLYGSQKYYEEHQKCVHCVMIEYSYADQKRIVYENEHFLAEAPFASKTAFEMKIFPKVHSPNFESIDSSGRTALADCLQKTLAKVWHGLKDPDYNLFLHTAPVRGNHDYQNYHWHLEILPKTATWAGFEIGTGIEISTIDPETAADFLREIKI